MNKQETMDYKGYTAVWEWDEEGNGWAGDVPGMDEYFVLQAETLPEARKAMEELIEFYLENCRSAGRAPCQQNIEAFAHSV